MDIYIVIPAHNEETYIGQTLQSLVQQTFLPKKIVVVDDHSTDNTVGIVQNFLEKYPFISLIQIKSEDVHLPGSKVINAFYKGYETLDDNYDVICKFDADLIFPNNYLETIVHIYRENPKCGMAGGLLYIEKNRKWEYEKTAEKYHLRGPIKSYRQSCFETIGGPKKAIGWDTVDVLLSQYYGFEVIINPELIVKHLKPTGKLYKSSGLHSQGRVLYTLRYGYLLLTITAFKMAFKQKSILLFCNYIKNYTLAKKEKASFLVSEAEGRFIRKYRWNKVLRKLFFY